MIARSRIRSIRLASLAKFGCLLGGLVAFAPSLVCGLTGLWLVGIARRWLDGLQRLTIGLPAPFPSAVIDMVDFLHLGELLRWLRFVDDWSPLAALTLVVGLSLAVGLVLAAMVALVGVGFNVIARLTGGLEVELEAPTESVLPADPREWQ